MKQTTTLDLTDKRAIVQHIRDLINIGPLLQMNLEEEIFKTLKKAEEAGWAKEFLDSMLEMACNHTIYEQYLERPIREKGDFWKYDWIQKITKTYQDKDFAAFKYRGAWAG